MNVGCDLALAQVNHRDVCRAGIRNIRTFPVGRDVDEVRGAMDPNRGHYGITLGINYRDVGGAGINHVNLVAPPVGGQPGGVLANVQSSHQAHGPQVDHRNRVAFTIADIGILAIRGIEIRDVSLVEVPPAESRR